jgi:hypothetical protein
MYGKRSPEEPYVRTSGALPYSLRQMLRASLHAVWRWWRRCAPLLCGCAVRRYFVAAVCVAPVCLDCAAGGCGRNLRDGLLRDVERVTLRVDGAYVAFARLLVQRDVLPDEYADAYPAEVEPVEEGVDLRELRQSKRMVLHLLL